MNYARAPLGTQLIVRGRNRKWPSDRSWIRIEKVAHQGALLLDNCRAWTELYMTKNDASLVFLSWFNGLVEHQEPKRFFAPAGMIRLPLGDELFLVSSTAPIRTRTGNRRLPGRGTPPPALTLLCAGICDDRPDLPADDWAAPPTTEPVAAAPIGSAFGSFAGAGAAVRGHRVIRQKERKN